MSKETEQSPAETPAGEKEITYHKAPSFLWIVIPFGLLLAYGYFSR